MSCLFTVAATSVRRIQPIRRWLYHQNSVQVCVGVPCLVSIYVDDGMLLLPKPAAPLLASACLAFLSALGVPLSWRKENCVDWVALLLQDSYRSTAFR